MTALHAHAVRPSRPIGERLRGIESSGGGDIASKCTGANERAVAPLQIYLLEQRQRSGEPRGTIGHAKHTQDPREEYAEGVLRRSAPPVR